MRRFIIVMGVLSVFGSAKAECGAVNSEPIDAVLTCAPLSKTLVYKCDVRVIHAKTGFPLCVHGGTIQFDMPSMPMAHHVPKIDLRTDTNGEMKDVEVRLEMYGEWRALVSASGSTVAKRIDFQSRSATPR
ncbi:MAG: hypothetical protein NTZ72_07115 [Afipia sp.]|nr:hypothetical protein [Afipia sp.]